MVLENERMVKIELEAAEALAGLAQFSTNSSESYDSESVVERVKDESNSSFNTFPKCSTNSNCEDATNFVSKKLDKLTSKSVKDERSAELRLNPTNCVSGVRKSRQNLTEEEMEARKIRRVLANRESARQTIRRRQAVFEELTRKAVALAWENDSLKRDKDNAAKRYNSLKTKNKCLKEQMIKVTKIETDETRAESITTNQPTISASSTNSPFIIYNQQPFLPLVWPNSVQLQCGPPTGIVFPSQITNKPDTSSCEEGNSMSSLYLLPYPWVVSLPQNSNNENHPHSSNLNDKPKETTEYLQFFPEKVKSETPNCNGFSHDGGGVARESNPRVAINTANVSSDSFIHENDDTNTSLLLHHLKASTVGDSEQVIKDDQNLKTHQPPVVCSGKRLCDTAAATEARKRRKELTRLKTYFHCRQLRMH
ncbi:uncharacterized protein [Rutidosis leptorrhynchoides]|uniref:uncharacterized protein n=1 Tax=Rutidosis leptorrhynchoides TaxID=125765 RepID=UPI003A98D7D7